MSDFRAIESVLRTLLFEGYVLFPYRATAMKNRLRTSFGELVPSGGFGRTVAHAELPLEGGEHTRVWVRVAFLQSIARRVKDAAGVLVDALEHDGELHQTWEEAREQSFVLGPIRIGEVRDQVVGAAPLDERIDLATDGTHCGCIERSARAVRCRVRLAWREGSTAETRVLRCEISNASATEGDDRGPILHAAHVSLRVEAGAFVSVIDPPPALRPLADACDSDGLWPFLAGAVGDRSLAVCSPIIVYDHPDLAPESPGETFDATENDELLTLAVLAMTDEEKRAMASTDPRARELLRRSEALGDKLGALHGAVRSLRTDAPQRLRADGAWVGVGDPVALAPHGRDVLDDALKGRRATVVDIQIEANGREHLVVVVDEDPGRDLGLVEHGLGHRFFVSPSEVRLIREGSEP